MSVVSIHKTAGQSYEEIKAAVDQVISDLGGLSDVIKQGDRVLIKPNLVAVPEERLSGAVTRWEVVKAVAERVRQEGALPFIAESASAGEDTKMVLLRCEYNNLSEGEDPIPVYDLKEQAACAIPVEDGILLKELQSWELVRDADAIISVPVMKTHDQTEVTLGLKNLKGLIIDQQKKAFHRMGVIEGVCDLIRTIRPKMTIVDGTFGQEGIGPVFGDTVKMDLIIGSKDVVACDAVTSAVMGYEPEEAMITKACCEAGLGIMDLSKITVKGESIASVKRRFVRASEVRLEGVAPYTLLIDDQTCTGCKNTVMSSMLAFENHQNYEALEDLFIVTGPIEKLPEEATPERTILVGRCCGHLKSQGTWIPGCPPLNGKVIDAILNKNKENQDF